MTSPERREVAEAFLTRARADLAAARALATDPRQDDGVIGFHAQQAVEKALKAVLVLAGVEVPRTHNIQLLLDLVAQGGQTIPAEVSPSDALTPWAVTFRYAQPVGPLDRNGALAHAVAAVLWAADATTPKRTRPRPEPRLTLAPLTPTEAKATQAWRYPAELMTYDLDADAAAAMLDLTNPYRGIHLDGEYVGYVCLGAEARVPGLDLMPGVVDFGIGLAPERVGQGLSGWLLPAVIDALMRAGALTGHTLRAVILQWNLRSQTAALHAGFTRAGEFVSDAGTFVVLTRPLA